jgi:thioesterase domain-containing protein
MPVLNFEPGPAPTFRGWARPLANSGEITGMPLSSLADEHPAPSGRRRNESDDGTAASSITTRQTDHERTQRIANALRWGEALWIRKQRPLTATIVGFHDANNTDETLLPCFMVPSLPQLSTDFIDLAGMMDPMQPFVALYLPSAKRNAETGASVQQLAEYYANEINKFHPTGPVAIAGWSAGATVALIVARLMLERGREVPLLIAIDGAPPSVDIGPSRLSEKIKIGYLRLAHLGISLTQLGCDLAGRLGHRRSQNRSVRDAVRIAWRNAAFRRIWERTTGSIASKMAFRMPGTGVAQRHPAEDASNISGLPSDHRAFAMALYDAVCNYTPNEIYPGNVLVFESTAEPARSSERVADKWTRIARNVEIVPIESTHMSIVRRPDGGPLADKLCRRLREGFETLSH